MLLGYVILFFMENTYDLNRYMNDMCHRLSAVYGDVILCQQYAWWILEAICKKTKTELIVQQALILSGGQQSTIEQWMTQLIEEKKPLQYILGFVPFADLEILVQPPTLIPRPETEEWCLNIIEQLLMLDDKKINILDLATGSGCIALACGYYLPQAKVVAIDTANSALDLTKKNAEHNKITNVTILASDLFTHLPGDIKYDIILSNPPYISADEYQQLDDTVAHWEDRDALVAQDDGLAIIKQIIAQAPQFIQTNNQMKSKNIPQLVIEIGYAQGKAVKELMESASYNDVCVHKDLEGKDRFVTGRVDHVANPIIKQ
jgi:release factor glutamine methyltransferase